LFLKRAEQKRQDKGMSRAASLLAVAVVSALIGDNGKN
jgi:hypothetical protein